MNITRRRLLAWMGSASVLAVAAGALPATLAQADHEPRYRDATAPVNDRVADLLSRMTLEEKVAQMVALWATKAEIMDGLDFNPEKAAQAYPHGIGQITRPSDRRGGPNVANAAGGTAARWREPKDTVKFINAVQVWATTETRLGIPVLFHEESLHGYMAPNATMFPQAIALAGSFDTGLMERVSSVIAREVRAHGVPYVLSPVVDIVRDPRWGRIEETFGEDPYLVTEMGVAAVEGLQGKGKFEKLADDKVYATLKHMTGHGQPQSGNNVAPAQLAERELRENFFPPFKAIVERTSVGAVMPSYNEIDGVPSHANSWLLKDVLRGEWGFDRVIASDYMAVQELDSLHHVATDLEDAARKALAATVDCELPDGLGYRTLVAQVKAGKVSEAAIDAAAGRMLALKFRAGLFENPFGDFAKADAVTGNAEARALALEAARKSLCLLTNDGTLPLDDSKLKTVAVIGPNAAIARLGGYSSEPRQTVTLLDAIRERLKGKAKVTFAQGVRITMSDDRSDDPVILPKPEDNRRRIREAVKVAKGADVIILAIGDTEQTSREGYAKTHLGDRTKLDLVGEQNELFDALHVLGKPVVVTAINGRPPSWPNVVEKAHAILECWYPGQEGGTAMAEALFGDINPGAKLPVTVIRHEGQIPYFHNLKPTARRPYLFDDTSPLFPFGHGLSYTNFEIGAPILSVPRIAADVSVTVSVTVKNTGERTGDEVVQLYLRDRVASVTQPRQKLCGFKRVTLQPGEERQVTFTLDPDAFAIWNREMQHVVEPGLFDIMAGPNSVDLKSAELEIV